MYAEMKCWDVSLDQVLRSACRDVYLNHVLRSSCWDMRCALTWVLRVRYWSTCPSLSGLRMLPSPPPASSRGLTALMSVNQEPTQHYNKCQETWMLKAIRLKKVFDFHDFFKKNKSGKMRQRPNYLYPWSNILTAFISYPLSV